MGRNSEYRFGQIPQVKISRSVFKQDKPIKGSFNTGDIVPFFVYSDVLPGDTWDTSMSLVCRMATPIYPVMDDLVLDTYFFAVPFRLVWDNFKKFMGENENGAWTQTTEYETPMTLAPSATGWTKGSIGDYMGLPIGVPNIQHSVLPIRAYREVYNYFFRNQNLIAPVSVLKNDNAGNSHIPSTYQTLFKASRLPDYLSTCLPEAQKSPSGAVKTPLGTTAPVYGNGKGILFSYDTSNPENYANTLLLKGGSSGNRFTNPRLVPGGGNYDVNYPTGTSGLSTSNAGDGQVLGLLTKGQKEAAYSVAGMTADSGMYVDLSEATASTINALRLSFQTQKLFETDARGGTRYTEVVKNHFGTISPDGRQQRPEYLGGKRIPIVMNQVAQTSATDQSVSPQGNVSAFSLTTDFSHLFTKSFTEHTIIIGCMVARILKHSYQQNLPRMWTRKRRLDYYWPVLSHLGEQPVYNKEIYADGSSTDDEIFGYQERWAEYKYMQPSIVGELRSTYATPLDSWHYGDNYASLPVLSQNWLEEDSTYVSRTLAVQNQDQFIFDCNLKFKLTRPMPVYCTPGLVDHF